MRQVVGAKRGQLIWQFLSESLLLSLVATALAVVLTYAFLPTFRRLTEKKKRRRGQSNFTFLEKYGKFQGFSLT